MLHKVISVELLGIVPADKTKGKFELFNLNENLQVNGGN
jgi:hypothetical protein